MLHDECRQHDSLEHTSAMKEKVDGRSWSVLVSMSPLCHLFCLRYKVDPALDAKDFAMTGTMSLYVKFGCVLV